MNGDTAGEKNLRGPTYNIFLCLRLEPNSGMRMWGSKLGEGKEKIRTLVFDRAVLYQYAQKASIAASFNLSVIKLLEN